MTNWQKYFGNPQKTAKTLENILFNKLSICRDLCKFKDHDCTDEALDNYDCIDAIKYFLNEHLSQSQQINQDVKIFIDALNKAHEAVKDSKIIFNLKQEK